MQKRSDFILLFNSLVDMFFKKCNKCNKRLFFKKKVIFNNNIYCGSCYNIIIDEKEKQDLNSKKIEQEKQKKEQIEKGKIRSTRADELLKKELGILREKQQKKFEGSLKKKQRKNLFESLDKNQLKNLKKNNEKLKKIRQKHFSRGEFYEHKKLLYIEANVKRLKVIEWLNGKERIVLNKEREIRRTHAGGFSQEKFQRFVDFRKAKTFEWIIDLLERPGVLRLPYDKIKIVSKDIELMDDLNNYFKKYKKINKL